ncbi:MAG: hypothetical protein HY922_15965 [Elusimicrobia bacterium]|nr:hypothetical protein [Elusimicrobiota bacterium]
MLKRKAGFHPLLLAQAERAAEGLEAFEEFIQAPTAEKGALAAGAATRAEAAAGSLLDALDRGTEPAQERRRVRKCARALEDLCARMRHIAKETTLFGAEGAPGLARMAGALRDAGDNLLAAILVMPDDPRACQEHLLRAKRSEQRLQTVYRRELAGLLKNPSIVTILKMKELYRQLSDAGHCGGTAAEVLAELLALTT